LLACDLRIVSPKSQKDLLFALSNGAEEESAVDFILNILIITYNLIKDHLFKKNFSEALIGLTSHITTESF